MTFILADNQDITRQGLQSVCHDMGIDSVRTVADKSALIAELQQSSDSIVVLDYTLFDIPDVNDLLIIHLRFLQVQWILFSEELSETFLRRIVAEGSAFSVVNKESSLSEINEAFKCALHRERYFCRRTTELLLTNSSKEENESPIALTKTEIEILKSIALGKTTKEIASERFSSFHTINTHRKNIFRKLKVNTAYEATKYAFRAGLVDSAEYYI